MLEYKQRSDTEINFDGHAARQLRIFFCINVLDFLYFKCLLKNLHGDSKFSPFQLCKNHLTILSPQIYRYFQISLLRLVLWYVFGHLVKDFVKILKISQNIIWKVRKDLNDVKVQCLIASEIRLWNLTSPNYHPFRRNFQNQASYQIIGNLKPKTCFYPNVWVVHYLSSHERERERET